MEFVTRYQQPSTVNTHAGMLMVFMASSLLRQAQARPVPEIFSGQIAQPLMFRNLLLGLRQNHRKNQNQNHRIRSVQCGLTLPFRSKRRWPRSERTLAVRTFFRQLAK